MRNNPDDLANQCIEKIIRWLNSNIDDGVENPTELSHDSHDLKEKIELFMEEEIDEFWKTRILQLFQTC